MPLEKSIANLDLIHENRNLILERLEAVKTHRATLPRAAKKPCVYLAGVQYTPRRKIVDPLSKTATLAGDDVFVDVIVFNVQGGHKKRQSIMNLERHGKFPIGYDFPDITETQHVAQNSDDTGTRLFEDSKQDISMDNPYGELRNYLDGRIKQILGGWKQTDRLSELDKKALDVEAQLAESQAKLAKAEQALASGKPVKKDKKTNGQAQKKQTDEAQEAEETQKVKE